MGRAYLLLSGSWESEQAEGAECKQTTTAEHRFLLPPRSPIPFW
jgi:hypothetical protein